MLQPFKGSTHYHACHAVEERRLPDVPTIAGAARAAAARTP
jgi:hypothetical protein